MESFRNTAGVLLTALLVLWMGCVEAPSSVEQGLCYTCYSIEPSAAPTLDYSRPDCSPSSGTCGCAGEPCCSDGCFSAQAVCVRGQCQPCGGPGQPCCLYTAWGAPFYGCNQWATQRCFIPSGCTGQGCTQCLDNCGQLNEPCCPTEPRCALLSGGTRAVCNTDNICRAF